MKKLKKSKFRGCKKLGDGVLEVGDRVRYYGADPSWPQWGVVTGIGTPSAVSGPWAVSEPTYKIRAGPEHESSHGELISWDDEENVPAKKIWVLK